MSDDREDMPVTKFLVETASWACIFSIIGAILTVCWEEFKAWRKRKRESKEALEKERRMNDERIIAEWVKRRMEERINEPK